MLKQDKSASLKEGKYPYEYIFAAGKRIKISRYGTYAQKYIREYKVSEAVAIREKSAKCPIRIGGVREVVSGIQTKSRLETKAMNSPMYWWLFQGKFYMTAERLKSADVQALAMEGENRKRLRLEKAHALMVMRQQLDKKTGRQPIPQEIKVSVWQRDKGRCVDCQSKEELEFDHIIPVAMGGANTERNIQLLCARCNRRKGATLG